MTPERQMVDVEGRQVRVSHLEKVMYPSTGMTKAEVMNYLVQVAPALLGQLRDRPVTRIRWTDGVGSEQFFEKNTPRGAPDWVRRQTLRAAPGADDEGAELELPVFDDLAALVWAANQGALDVVYIGVIEDHRKAAKDVEEIDDVTNDLLVGHLHELELFHWFVRAHLESAGGVLTTGNAQSEKTAARKAAAKDNA